MAPEPSLHLYKVCRRRPRALTLPAAGGWARTGLFGARVCAGLVAALLLASLWPAGVRAQARYNWLGLLQSVASRHDPEGLLLRAAAYLNLGRIAQALQVVDELSRMRAQEMAGPVIAQCEERLQEDPNDLAALHCVAVGRYALNEVEPALGVMWRIVELDPENPWPLNLIAIAQLTGGDLASARATAERALGIDRENQYTHLILSHIYLRQRNYFGFLAHFLRAPDAARELHAYLKSRQSSGG